MHVEVSAGGAAPGPSGRRESRAGSVRGRPVRRRAPRHLRRRRPRGLVPPGRGTDPPPAPPAGGRGGGVRRGVGHQATSSRTSRRPARSPSTGRAPAVLVMGSGSSPRRMRWCLVRLDGRHAGRRRQREAQVYAAAACRWRRSRRPNLGAPASSGPTGLQGPAGLPGACVSSGAVQPAMVPSRAGPRGGSSVPASVDLDLDAVWSAALGEADCSRPAGHPSAPLRPRVPWTTGCSGDHRRGRPAGR